MQAAILAADAFKASGAGCSCRATFRSGAPPGGQLAVGTVTPGAGGANESSDNMSSPILAATFAADTLTAPRARCAYRAVVWICECPSSFPIMGKLSPRAKALDAKLCLRS